ncbi:MAG: PilT/PilU family type 4a pilus ATPase [Akkermansiaceae bacterium]|nr:PilT/PilU family type 4a pilus ATPase [Akkermansiaceae bacterium]
MSDSNHTIVDFLRAMVKEGASDLHISVGIAPSVRLDGEIVQLKAEPLDEEAAYKLVMSLLNDSQRATLEETRELDFAVKVDNVGRFRGNAHYNQGAVEATYRHIPQHIPNLAQLGHEPTVEHLCDMKDGLILVTGITGSGKSSTLAAMVKRIAERRREVIISVEDPIEFVFEHSQSLIKQREVGQDTLSFAAALKHVLRQDPGVILVSELRDIETIQAAVTAAETGHLVISTLHTLDAPRSLDRLIDVFPPAQQSQIIAQLANCLRAVVSQRLIPEKYGNGRVLAEEVMLMNYSIKNCLRDKKFEQIQGLIEIGLKEGMFTIDHHLVQLLEQDRISIEEAFANCRDDTLLKAYVKNHQQK